jgi:tetratricopeptide (TPR) repeat protein
MMLRAYALTADENGRFQEAASSYEAALLSDPADLETTVNLAVLYWRATGRGRSAPSSLPQEFLKQAQKRLRELLESAGDRAVSEGTPSGGERFADRAELRFWKKYIAAADAGEPLEPGECRQLLQERPDYLEPAFVVFSDSAGEEAEPEAMRLLVDYSEQPTARGRYVTAIIDAVMRKQRWHAGLEPTA